MSLHALATDMASKGRNGDSMLVHMTPGEVAGLHALALKHGGSLTINPDTGLPEANFLKSLLPMLAGFALNAFVPGLGAAVGGMFGASAAVGTGIAVGGLTGLATGSLSKGLMAGLGAYGGAGLQAGLAGAGSDAFAREALSVEGALPSLENATTVTGEGYGGSVANYQDQVNSAVKAARDTASGMPTSDLMSAGAKAAGADPMGFAKQNWMPMAAASLPVLQAITTTTPGPTASPVNPGRIREKRWDGRQFVDVANTDANVYNTSGRSFSDFYRGYNNGGIVALAKGGAVPGYAEGDLILDAYQKGNYDLANKLIADQKLSAQDVVSKYNLDAAQAADVAKNLGYAGDKSALQYGTGYVAPPAAPVYNQYTDQGITDWMQDFATKNTRGAYNADEYDVAGQLKDAIKTYNPDPAQVSRILNSGAVVPIYGGAVAGGTDVNLKDYINEFNMATSKTPLVDANGRITLDATRAAQAAQNELDTLFDPNKGSLMPIKNADFESGGKYYGRIGERDKMIADWYRDPANKAKIDAAQKTVFDKYGVPENMRLAPRAISTNLAQTDIAAAPSAYVDPSKFTNYKDYAAAQNAASLKAFEDEIAINKKYGIDLLQRYKTGDVPSPAEVKLANLRAGLLRDGVLPGEQNRFTGTTAGVDAGSGIAAIPRINATQNTIANVISPTDIYTAPSGTLPVGVSGNTGPSQIGGGATINPNGTITTSPRIPDIPVGGFTGMQNLRDTYEKGGGSLGYTSPTYTPEEFTKKYASRLSGDSKAAYDYLTGKAGAAYPTKSGVGQISRPYDEAVLGYPARGNLPYIYNKATGKMDPNPDYVAPGRDAAGNVTYSMSTTDIKKALTDAPLSGQALYDWAMSNNLSAQQIADATGRTLSSVYADFRAGSNAKTVADKKKIDDAAAASSQIDTTQSGGGDGGGEAAGGLQQAYAMGGMPYSGGGLGTLGGYSDGGRLLKGPGDGVSDSIPATIGRKQQPARLADGEFVVPARIVSELGNGSTDAGAKKLYAMMDRVQRARGKTTGKNKVAANSRADKYLPA